MGVFTPFVRKRNSGNTVERTMAERNVRVNEQIFPQEAPDPIRQGATPARPARVQVATFSYDMEVSSDWRFQAINPDYSNRATGPNGRQTPLSPRVNTAPPQHVAYGSLFTQDAGGGY